MTNTMMVLATVVTQLVTNTITGDNGKGCSYCGWLDDCARQGFMPAVYHPDHGGRPYIAPTKKWVEEVVVERSTLTIGGPAGSFLIGWEGKTIVTDSEISRRRKESVREEVWKDSKWAPVEAPKEFIGMTNISDILWITNLQGAFIVSNNWLNCNSAPK